MTLKCKQLSITSCLYTLRIWTDGSSSSRDTWNSVCGDGYRVESEQSDDANTNNGDGCSYQCNVETGYKCIGGSSLNNHEWTPICGDGLKIGSEKWDYHNLIPGDGLSNTWTIEAHWKCSGGSGILAFYPKF